MQYMADLHLTQMAIFQKFLEDPRTINLRMKHTASLHRAVLVKRGKIIADATNNYGNRSRGSGYSQSSIHAEKNVVKEAWAQSPGVKENWENSCVSRKLLDHIEARFTVQESN